MLQKTFRLLPLGGVDSDVPSFQLHPVFGAVSSRVPPSITMSRFVGFRDKIWDNFKNGGADKKFDLQRRPGFGEGQISWTPS